MGGASRRAEVRPYPNPEMRSTNKLEKSRQSARECRARKKLRYQYLDDMILEREKENDALREELTKYVGWCQMLDQSQVPDGLQELLTTTQCLRLLDQFSNFLLGFCCPNLCVLSSLLTNTCSVHSIVFLHLHCLHLFLDCIHCKVACLCLDF